MPLALTDRASIFNGLGISCKKTGHLVKHTCPRIADTPSKPEVALIPFLELPGNSLLVSSARNNLFFTLFNSKKACIFARI